MMKKSTFGAILAFLFAAAGALTAAALYLRRREKELETTICWYAKTYLLAQSRLHQKTLMIFWVIT